MIARIIIVTAIAIALTASAAAGASVATVSLLKQSGDRVYFDAGSERYIFGGHAWAIICSGDTVATGTIERSFDGLSFGRIDSAVVLAIVDSCDVLIETARVDSTATITVGVVESSPLTDWLVVTCRRPDSLSTPETVADTSRSVVVRSFESALAMILAFEQGEIDGMLDMSLPDRLAVPYEQRPVAAPYYFALLPSLSSRATDDGLLTTSLYYRFDDRRLTEMYDGTAPSLYTRLYLSDRATIRPYDYSPATGRGLLGRMNAPVRRVGLAYEYETLRALAEYFGDVLSRDRIRITIDRHLPDPDLRIAAIPLYRERPWQSMEVLAHVLAQDTVAASRGAELVRQTFERLQLVRRFHDQPQGATYLDRTERGLIDDIGVFPLFRPTLFVITSPHITGVEITAEGRVDFCGAGKLIAPSPEAKQ